MSKKLTKVNWDNVTPGKIREVASMCTKTNPEVSKKIMNKIPNLMDYGKEFSNTIIKSNDASINNCYNIAKMQIESENEYRRSEAENEKKRQENIGKILENDNLSPEQKSNLMNQINEFCKSYNDQDSEHRQYIKEIGEKVYRKDEENRENNNRLIQWFWGIVVLLIYGGIEYQTNKNQNDRT